MTCLLPSGEAFATDGTKQIADVIKAVPLLR
jgi:hypothetical protein